MFSISVRSWALLDGDDWKSRQMKCHVFAVKNKTFYCLCIRNENSTMAITKRIREILDATPPGRVLSIADFDVLHAAGMDL